jgi:hypothetical protein
LQHAAIAVAEVFLRRVQIAPRGLQFCRERLKAPKAVTGCRDGCLVVVQLERPGQVESGFDGQKRRNAGIGLAEGG